MVDRRNMPVDDLVRSRLKSEEEFTDHRSNYDSDDSQCQRNIGIESHLFRKSHFDRINKFVEAHSYHFTPLDSIHDRTTDADGDSDLVADVDPDTLIRIVRTELKMVRLQVWILSTISFSRRQ